MTILTKIKTVDNKYLPEMKRQGDACFDCRACLDDKITIKSGERTTISLGFSLELPTNTEAIIRARSGLSKKGIDVCIGTIDSNYRGMVMANVVNNSDADFVVEDGDRICQLAIRKLPMIEFMLVDKLEESERGENGFGSTGLK